MIDCSVVLTQKVAYSVIYHEAVRSLLRCPDRETTGQRFTSSPSTGNKPHALTPPQMEEKSIKKRPSHLSNTFITDMAVHRSEWLEKHLLLLSVSHRGDRAHLFICFTWSKIHLDFIQPFKLYVFIVLLIPLLNFLLSLIYNCNFLCYYSYCY